MPLILSILAKEQQIAHFYVLHENKTCEMESGDFYRNKDELKQIKSLRKNSNMTQNVFAKCLGASKKSVEAWEVGRTKPDGATRRLLGLLQDNPYILQAKTALSPCHFYKLWVG